MEGYNSTLTGSQIEERLQLVPKNSQDIELLNEAIKAFVSSEQMQTAITSSTPLGSSQNCQFLLQMFSAL